MKYKAVLSTRFFGAPCEDVNLRLPSISLSEYSIECATKALSRLGFHPIDGDFTEEDDITGITVQVIPPSRNADCAWVWFEPIL